MKRVDEDAKKDGHNSQRAIKKALTLCGPKLFLQFQALQKKTATVQEQLTGCLFLVFLHLPKSFSNIWAACCTTQRILLSAVPDFVHVSLQPPSLELCSSLVLSLDSVQALFPSPSLS